MFEFLENFLTSPWLLIIILFMIFGWMISGPLNLGNKGFIAGGIIGLLSMLVMDTVDMSLVLFSMFIVFVVLAIWQKKG